jgi:ribosome-binding protein aMBF1 (putative translation factor)
VFRICKLTRQILTGVRSERGVLSTRCGMTIVDHIPWTGYLRQPNDDSHMPPENIAAIFGKVLREQRNARGISQEALALSADVDRTFVSQMERGIRQPTLTTLCKLSEALEIQPSTLVARVERMLR